MLNDDQIFAMIEERELQFLLTDSQKIRYKAWLSKSAEYKQQVREEVRMTVPPIKTQL